jgi:2-iminobutanoate/2-iminopropanoate deaminase
MPPQYIRTDDSGRVPLSPAVKTGNLVFVSGTPAYFGNRQIARGDFPAQMHQVIKNIQAALAAAGSSLDRVVKMNVILVRKSDWDDMNRIYREYFTEGFYPARTTIVCDLANPDFLLEIECVAEAEGRTRDGG